MSEIGLGRLRSEDPRDRSFRMAAPPPQRTFRNWLVPGGISDQGGTSQCVAYACEAFLRALPTVNAHRSDLAIDRPNLYREAQKVDEWPGEDYDGTSVRAGFKVLHRLGFIKGYSWAWDAEAVARHVLEIGPVVVGTVWTYEMFTPDRYGYIWKNGAEAGGHAYLLTGFNGIRRNPDGTSGAFRMQNSWGAGWGQKGRAWIASHVMQSLIADWGEACTATENRVR